MIKKKVQKSSNTSFKKTINNKLSIQFNLDGFSFCISNSTTNKDIFFSEYLFKETITTPEQLLSKIKDIFKTDKNLQYDFSSVLVIHQNALSCLVPNEYFNENKLESYLSYNIKSLTTDYITFDNLEILKCKNVYIPYVNINNYIFQNFGEFEYKHHSTVLIEKLISIKNGQEKKMYLNVSKTSLDIFIFEKNRLLFYNSFNYSSKEDFIYYILFTAEQLKLDTENLAVFFLGDIEKDSETYKIAYKYIRNINFLESNNPIFNQINASKHSNFTLLGL
ncbi:DUF3822 family protein [Polaribacter aquimarinus]|uniref:DUF3822 domain-containing protein n=1 Tax=Polaribacter aquimarinus TaxID=2100726 RepID=A0A2U2J9J7_9FLAO|nr:DUF3822 family protein [Polaribacter aquimarinus]PWG04994.1 DUF3822 domain-containing protein [Polaribacter aquimarinus]